MCQLVSRVYKIQCAVLPYLPPPKVNIFKIKIENHLKILKTKFLKGHESQLSHVQISDQRKITVTHLLIIKHLSRCSYSQDLLDIT
jgi:hypothetical protein